MALFISIKPDITAVATMPPNIPLPIPDMSISFD